MHLSRAAALVFLETVGDAAGDTAQGFSYFGTDVGYVVESGNPRAVGVAQQPGFGNRERGEGGAAGVDDVPEDAGGLGLAAAGGAAEDEDGVCPLGAAGGQEPGHGTEPVFFGGGVEETAELVEGIGAGFGGGVREVLGGLAAQEVETGAVFDFPAGLGDGEG